MRARGLMWWRLQRVAAVLGAVVLASCGSDAIETPTTDAATLAFVNASASRVDVRVDGTVRFTSVAPSSVTAGIVLSPGAHTVQFASSGATAISPQVAVAISRAERRAVVVTSSANGLGAMALADTGSAVAVGRSKLRVLHFASSAPPLDIWRTQPDYQTPISVMFPYAYLSGATMESAAGTWEVRVWPTGAASWSSAMSALVVPVASGQIRTVVTLDAPGGGVKLQLLDP